jgi:hypothetical protein
MDEDKQSTDLTVLDRDVREVLEKYKGKPTFLTRMVLRGLNVPYIAKSKAMKKILENLEPVTVTEEVAKARNRRTTEDEMATNGLFTPFRRLGADGSVKMLDGTLESPVERQLAEADVELIKNTRSLNDQLKRELPDKRKKHKRLKSK